MEQLIEFIAKSLVDDPAQVEVRRRNSGQTIVLELRVAAEDAGRVIGRNGRVANAIRALLYASADRGKRVILKIV
jgi:predicted RNA-binding protein YlqC (UPF0109 family)